MKIHVIGSETVVLGFALVGFRGTVCSSPDEVYAALQRLICEQNTGLILITSKLAQMAADLVEEIKFSREIPLLIEIPDEKNYYCKSQSLEQIVKEVGGFSQ